MRDFGSLSNRIVSGLRDIEPSQYMDLIYYPCGVSLTDGSYLDCVYIVEAQPYITIWGCWPDEDTGKRSISHETVLQIHQSKNRLPETLANQLYVEGESGMGYVHFQAKFSSGFECTYLTGNAIDFLEAPEGQSVSEIVEVSLSRDFKREPQFKGLEYHWCLYGNGESPYRRAQ